MTHLGVIWRRLAHENPRGPRTPKGRSPSEIQCCFFVPIRADLELEHAHVREGKQASVQLKVACALCQTHTHATEQHIVLIANQGRSPSDKCLANPMVFMILWIFRFFLGVLVVGRGSIGFLGRFCFGFIEYQPKRRHDDPFMADFTAFGRYCAILAPLLAIIGIIIGHYWQFLAIIGYYCAIIAPLLRDYCAIIAQLLATIGRYWSLLVAIGRYWPLLLLTRTFRGYLSK